MRVICYPYARQCQIMCASGHVCMVHLTLKTTLKLDVLADCIVQAGLNQFSKILGHCKPILALNSAILITKIVGSPSLYKDPYI